jgi:hypothetical protein
MLEESADKPLESSQRAFYREGITHAGVVLYNVTHNEQLTPAQRREVLLVAEGHLHAWLAMVEREIESLS